MHALDVAQWAIGPPPPITFTRVTRVLQAGAAAAAAIALPPAPAGSPVAPSPTPQTPLPATAIPPAQASVLLTMCVWIFGYLGGLRLSPRPTGGDPPANDTSQLFNLHPLLITLAFPVLMAEAVLAFRAPLVPAKDHGHAKAFHLMLHTAALVCTGGAVAAAFLSHTLKQPVKMANLYSSHSYCGLAVLALLAAQYSVGAAAYVFPKWTLAHRRALGPVHSYLGRAVFVAGLATMAVSWRRLLARRLQPALPPSSVAAAAARRPPLLFPRCPAGRNSGEADVHSGLQQAAQPARRSHVATLPHPADSAAHRPGRAVPPCRPRALGQRQRPPAAA